MDTPEPDLPAPDGTPIPAPGPSAFGTSPEPVGPPSNLNSSVPMSPEEIQAFIEQCRNTGVIASTAAAIAACAVIINKCPVPEPDASDNIAALSLQEEPPLPAVEVLEGVLDEACRSQAIESCKRNAFNSATTFDPECARVLNRGPALTVVGCEDLKTANQIFADENAKVCEASSG
eukprot:evm.model.scf_34EXC.7 EVM.evm.TU.scf_34EXC.7   scf_34EXC:106411-108442(+)